MENALTGTGTARFHSERRHFGESRLKKTVSISPPSGRAEAFRQGSDGFSRYRDASGCVVFSRQQEWYRVSLCFHLLTG